MSIPPASSSPQQPTAIERGAAVWWWFALASVLPLVAALGSYLISASNGQVPWCWPMFEGCTSISRAARVEPAIYLFRLLMLPQALLLLALWWLIKIWLQQQAVSPRAARGLFVAGVIGALALALYSSFLGSSGEFYQFMRRFGITIHFAGTGLAQLLVVRAMRRIGAPRTSAFCWLWYLVLVQWLLAILHVVLKASLADYDAWENRLEWSLALLMTLWFAAMAWQWRQQHWHLALVRQP